MQKIRLSYGNQQYSDASAQIKSCGRMQTACLPRPTISNFKGFLLLQPIVNNLTKLIPIKEHHTVACLLTLQPHKVWPIVRPATRPLRSSRSF